MVKRKKSKRARRNPAKFSKVVVASVLAAVALFTVAMICLYALYGGVPDTLIVSFFGFAGGEAGVLGLIKCNDERTKKKPTPTDEEAAG